LSKGIRLPGCQSCGGGGEKLTSLTDAVNSKTSFAYNQRGLLTAITDPLQQATSFTYNIDGRLSTSTDRDGTVLTYAYTPTGKLSSITYPDQTRVKNTYDNLDRLTQMQDSIGTSSFSYDANGRITGFTDPDGFALSYTYDAAGNITRVTYPDNTTVTYAYDAANRMATVTDWLDGQATYAYDQDGRLEALTHFNGIVTDYTYDIASRLTGIASSVASYEFALDGDGNRVQSLESQPIASAASNGVPAVYTYNAQKDRLLSNGSISYTYDSEGQLISAGGVCLTFDYNHRVVAIGDDASFVYDGRGNRLIATLSGVTTYYIYDPWGNLVAEADSSGNIISKYIYGKGLLAMVIPGGRYCYHFDGMGNTTAVTDMNQNVVNSYAYEPFGLITNQSETIPQPFKFVGQYGVMADPSGLYYMRARYYDPSVGRFISEDPLGLGGGDVNLFAYVQNNPVKRIDPWGLIWVTTGYNYSTGWNFFNTMFNWMMDEIGNGMKPTVPGYTPGEYTGDRRQVTQEWQHDPDNPCRDKENPIGTQRRVPQEWTQFWRDPNQPDVVQDPNSPYYYQWNPWVPNTTYEDFPNSTYKYPWEKGW
jgi:RHS repeat-associated protein